MNVLEVILIANMIALCVYSSITDIRHSVIKNKAVVISLLVSLAVNIIYY